MAGPVCGHLPDMPVEQHSSGPATIRVGISGWSYAGWRRRFYPAGLVRHDELSYAAQRFSSIEVNGSFYSLQRPSSYATWAKQTPDDFVLAVKGGRYITHMLRLAGVENALANFFASGVLALGHKLGPVLWQLPPSFAFDDQRLARFFGQLPRDMGEAARLAAGHDDKVPDERALTTTDVPRQRIRHALEVRHESFRSAQAYELLRRHDVALVVADTAGRWPMIEEVTSDFVYVRLHGAEELYTSGYDDPSLERWAARVLRWAGSGRDVYVYFDNDAKVHAPYDALSLLRILST